MLVLLCVICGEVDTKKSTDGLCSRCERLKRDAEAKAEENLQQRFGKHVTARLAVINLCDYLRREKPAEWEECFGTRGTELLDVAMSDSEMVTCRDQEE